MTLASLLTILILYLIQTGNPSNEGLTQTPLALKNSVKNSNEQKNALQNISRQMDWIKDEEDEANGSPEFVNRGIEDDDVAMTPNTNSRVRIFRAMLDDAGGSNQDIDQKAYHLDPVLNVIRKNFRRQLVSDEIDLSGTLSESREFKANYKEIWLKKKLEALNQSEGTIHHEGANQPWGRPCGDPAQRDMPWGTCMLAKECDAEFRIYRGDYICGRMRFVCCAIMFTHYNLYQGFDISMRKDSLPTTSEEIRLRLITSKERRIRKEKIEKKQRVTDRENRKTKIRKDIKKTKAQFDEIIFKQYRNRTKERRRRTRQLQMFLKSLKQKFRKDRKDVMNYRETDITNIDMALGIRLKHMLDMNQEFVTNQTYRDWIVSGAQAHKATEILEKASGGNMTEFLRQLERLKALHPPAPRPARRSFPARPNRHRRRFDIEYGYLDNDF